MRVFAVVVVGPPGSGKTSVLTALHDLLADGAVAHAVIEAEAVAWAHPPVGDGQALRHLESLCRMYEATGCELILVGATATSGEHLARILAAVGAADHLVVRLEASPATLRERIVEREPPGWSGLRGLVDGAEEIAHESGSLQEVDLVCSTEASTPLAVAGRIQRARPELLGTAPDEQHGVTASRFSDDELTDRWEGQELGGNGISHIDHVRVGWVLHGRHGAAQAEERLVEGTRKGCDHYGVPEKFDEHLTRLWARAISGAAGDESHSATFQEFIARNPHLRRGDLFGKR